MNRFVDQLTALLKRPECTTLIVALLVTGIVATGLPERVGIAVPEAALQQLVVIFWAIFLGAVFEGKFKGIDYAGGFRELFRSTKFRLGLATTVGLLLNAALKPFGYALPDDALQSLTQFVILVILGIAGVDGYQARQVDGYVEIESSPPDTSQSPTSAPPA